jgi:6-phosphogluconolactonase
MMKTRILLGAAGLLLLLVLFACTDGSIFPGAAPNAIVANPTVPKFLISIDGSGAGTNVNVFPIDATTGILGTAVAGSPFDLGLVNGMTLAVHPNGHFVYAADNDGTIHAWNVNETTGVPTEIAAALTNESGSFYQPCCGPDDAATHVITITPNGKYLYSANHDATVGAYSIGANGALTHISDLDLGACDTGAITANDSYAWVTDTCGNSGPWNVFTMAIGPSGALTNSSSVALTQVYAWLWSIQVNPVSNFLYVGDEGGNAQVYSFSIATDGSLTQLGPQIVENGSSDCRDFAHSPDGKFFYTTDDADVIHGFSVDTTTGAIAELAGSPWSGGAGQVVADVTGKYVYIGADVIMGFSRDMTTGLLTPISSTVTANGVALAVGIVR